MLSRRTPLKRSGFKSRAPAHPCYQELSRDERAKRNAARIMASASPRLATMVPCAPAAAPVPKENPEQNEAYRRLVAAMPCAHCGIQGYSQHAHLNLGKGLALKTDDRTGFPLCCTRPGEEGCHVRYDQYRLLPGGAEAHHEAGRAWGAQTRAQIRESGHWPKRLPVWAD